MKQIAKNNFYEIGVNKPKNRIYIKVKGFWNKRSEVSNYPTDIRRASKEVSDGFAVVADLREMKTPSREIDSIHQKAQAILVQAGLERTAEILNSAITKLATKRYAKKSQMKKKEFNSVEDAEKWLDRVQ